MGAVSSIGPARCAITAPPLSASGNVVPLASPQYSCVASNNGLAASSAEVRVAVHTGVGRGGDAGGGRLGLAAHGDDLRGGGRSGGQVVCTAGVRM